MRTLDARFLNEIANEPNVRPCLGGSGPLDLAPLVNNPENFTFISSFGGFVGVKQQPGIYEIHTIFRQGDGSEALKFAGECMRWMFCHTDCTELRTRIPKSNPAARWLAVKSGMSKVFERQNAWEADGGLKEDVIFLTISIDKWAAFDNACGDEGRTFDPESSDAIFCSYLGAALLISKSGNLMKGVGFYNRWAPFAGCEMMRLISLTPAVFGFHNKIIHMNGEEVEIIPCP